MAPEKVKTIIDVLISILGEPAHGLEFVYILIAGLLLIFVFHLIEHILEIFFSRFFKN